MAGLCVEWSGESTRPVRAPSAAAGLGTCTCQRAQREARERAAAGCGVGGESDSGDQLAALQVGWSTDAGGDTLAVWWAQSARGAGRAGARQGRRCLAAAGLTSARRLPCADTRPTGMFLSYPDGGCGNLCREQCSGAGCVGHHAQHSCTGGHSARDGMVVTRSGRMRPVSGRAGMALGGGPVGAGGRGWPPDPAQPTPASRRHAAECHHATAPGHPTPRVRRRVARSVRGWEMAIRVGSIGRQA